MKTTVKLTPYKRIVIEPNKIGGINFEVICGQVGKITTSELHQLTPDQAGALSFALEQAYGHQLTAGGPVSRAIAAA